MEQLNVKTRNWKDLVNDEPFTRKELVTIQDPTNPTKFNLSTFHHIKNNLRVEDEGNLIDRACSGNVVFFFIEVTYTMYKIV